MKIVKAAGVAAHTTERITAPAGKSMAAPSADAETGIGAKAIQGSVWMLAAAGGAKALGLGCQVALAWFLTKQEFGVYAIAMSLSVLLSVLRDGGLPMVLIEKGRRFDEFAGPVFWMMLAINSATCLVIAACAQPAARFYQIPELAGVLVLCAINLPLCGLPAVLSMRLNVSMKFRELGLVQLASAITRYALMLLFAAEGFGARSFILPFLITNVTDSLILWLVTRYSPWAMRPGFDSWPELFRSGRWVLLGTFAIQMGYNGAFFLLGKFLPSDIVGTYFFAYQLVMQLEILVAENAYLILFAAFARMRDDPARIRAAVLRALSAVVVAGSAASLSIAAVYDPLEFALWHGKWSVAADAIHVLALVWPIAAVVCVFRALQISMGRFRQWALVMSLSAAATLCGTALGAYAGGSAAGAATGYGVGLLLAVLYNGKLTLENLGIGAGDTARSVLRPWLIIAGAAACAQLATHAFNGAPLNLLASALCFATVGFFGLKLLASDSFQLVARALGEILREKIPQAAKSPGK
jgi:O-antigen/teichoic acid export membrane protein